MSWVDEVEVGDILRAPNGVLRVVRAVHRYKKPRWPIKTWVYFTIRRCSWTHRCYTLLCGTDLKARGYRPTGKKFKLNKRIDRKIEKEFGMFKAKLRCCDVEAIP